MVKLTPELIEHAIQYTNALRDRELDLRGYKMPAIENLGSTLDQFDTIDFTDNEIRRLDGFPLLNRLKNLVLTDNKIMRIGIDISESLPNLETIILTANMISELKDIDPLAYCQRLTFLSLMHNPVALKANYRLYIIGRIPSLRFLDYRRITLAERKQAKSFMKHAYVDKRNETNGQESMDTGKENGDIPSVAVTNGAQKDKNIDMDAEQTNLLYQKSGGASSQDIFAIQEAIKRAKTLAEVERLQHILSNGQFVGFANKVSVNNKSS